MLCGEECLCSVIKSVWCGLVIFGLQDVLFNETRFSSDGACLGLPFFRAAFPPLLPAPGGIPCTAICIKFGTLRPRLAQNQSTKLTKSPFLSAAATT